MSKSGVRAFLIKELKEVWPPTLFFAVSFNLLVLTINLILANYLRSSRVSWSQRRQPWSWGRRCWWRSWPLRLRGATSS